MASPTVQAQAIPTYAELLAQQVASRLAFGRMLLNWRRRNSWSQYTAFTWAEAIGEPKLVISYGNLSVIEQGKAGELRQRAFWQLWELNRRIAGRDWGRFRDGALRQKLEAAIPLGDAECPVWGPLEFWACYGGLRPVPAAFAVSPAPVIGPRQAALLSNRWRQQLRSLIESHQLDPATALPPQRGSGHSRVLSEAAHSSGLTVRLARFWVGPLQQRQWGRGLATGPAHTHRIPRPVLTPRQGSGHAPLRGVLAAALRPAGGGGVLCRPQMAAPLSRSALRVRDALVLEHLPLPLLALWGQRHMRLLLSHTYAIHTQLLVVELADLSCAAP